MGFQQVVDLDADVTVALGGFNKKAKKDNPISVEGYYLGNRQVASKKAKSGFCSLHYFQTNKGNLAVWGKTDLDRKLGNVVPGQMVRASFSHMQETPNGEMYKYKVEVDAENTIEVGNLAVGSSTTAPEEYGNNGDDASAEDSDIDEETQALLAAEQAKRAAKVQELLNKGKK